MILENSKEINNIENCPNQNEIGTKRLYRCVSNPLNKDSFKPFGLIPKHKNKCEAWGLSVYNNLESAKNRLKSLSKNLSSNYNAVAVAKIDDEDGIKYQTFEENHYTFFPKLELDLINKFNIVKDDK